MRLRKNVVVDHHGAFVLYDCHLGNLIDMNEFRFSINVPDFPLPIFFLTVHLKNLIFDVIADGRRGRGVCDPGWIVFMEMNFQGDRIEFPIE